MDKFTTLTGVAAPLDAANVDTDQIIPKQFLLAVDRKGFGVHLFHERRYLDDAETIENPDFVLNKPAYRSASILVARRNFGNGSSREHAPWTLLDFGIRGGGRRALQDPRGRSRHEGDGRSRHDDLHSGREDLALHARSFPPQVPPRRPRRGLAYARA